MKDFLLELWKMLPELVRQKLLPLLAAAAILLLGYLGEAYYLANTSSFLQIVKQWPFQLLTLGLGFVLAIVYIPQFSMFKSIPKVGYRIILLMLFVTMCYLLWQHHRKPMTITIILYQLGAPSNYDWDDLNSYVAEINAQNLPITFKLYEPQYDLEAYVNRDSIYSGDIFNGLIKSHPHNSFENKWEVVIGLTSHELHDDEWENLISSTGVGPKYYSYAAVSTYGLENSAFKAKRLNICRYLVFSSLCAMLEGSGVNNPIMPHPNGQSIGCIFDFTGRKIGVIQQMKHPVICQPHQAQIIDYFGSIQYLDAIRSILNFSGTR
jgi:hypothetical protein